MAERALDAALPVQAGNCLPRAMKAGHLFANVAIGSSTPMDLSTVDTVYVALAFLVPGFILSSVKSKLVTGRERQTSEQLLRYLTYSAANYALFSWLIYLLISQDMGIPVEAGLWFVVTFVGPAMLGALYGIAIKKNWERNFFRLLKLYPAHVVPTAWDWKFGNTTAQWVLITLKDDTKFAGYLGLRSFISSDPGERDIYVEYVYDITDAGEWLDVGQKSVLITSGEIRTIEFWPA